MINVNELMLFSIIDTPIGIRRVKGFTVVSVDNAIIEVDNGTTHDAKLCSGILLTPEWLERCGFKFEHYCYSNGNFSLGQNFVRDASGDYDGFYLKVHLNDKKISCVIRHLHQLQKLYFAMTVEELNVKL